MRKQDFHDHVCVCVLRVCNGFLHFTLLNNWWSVEWRACRACTIRSTITLLAIVHININLGVRDLSSAF